MATHSSVLALRIPGTGEPGGLPSIRSHTGRHDQSNLAAAAWPQGHLLREVFTWPGTTGASFLWAAGALHLPPYSHVCIVLKLCVQMTLSPTKACQNSDASDNFGGHFMFFDQHFSSSTCILSLYFFTGSSLLPPHSPTQPL